MRILIVEEGLRTLHGHYFQYLRDLADGGRALGHEIDILGHRDMSSEIAGSVGAKPWLSQSVLIRPRVKGPYARIRCIRNHNLTLHREVLEWCSHSGKHYDATIFPSVRIDHLWGIHLLGRAGSQALLGQIFAIMIDGAGLRLDDGTYRFPRSTLPLSAMMRWVSRGVAGRRIAFAAESEEMARQLKAFCGVDFITVPHVTVLPEDVVWRGLATSEKPERLRFGSFGFTRYDKGLDVLQDAIKLIPETSPDSPEFVLQWTGDYSLPCGKVSTKDPSLEKRGHVAFIPAFADSREYHQHLKSIDAIVLPYRKEFYRDRMSRVAVDAALTGLPAVFPRDTWLESFFSDYGSGVAFTAEDPSSLAEAVQTLVAEYPEYSAKSLGNMEKTERDYSAKQFFSIIGRATG